MLDDKAFEQWYQNLGLSDQAKAIITQIRTSPPSRHVQSAAGNVSGDFPSQKMKCSIQFESHRQAVWTLGDLYAYLSVWAYDVYDLEIHPALGQSPREAFAMGLARSGTREHLKSLYDDDFQYLSLASTRKGTAQVEPGRGVKINYLYYYSNAFQLPTSCATRD